MRWLLCNVWKVAIFIVTWLYVAMKNSVDDDEGRITDEVERRESERHLAKATSTSHTKA